MMRLPHFRWRTPTRLDEAARILAAEGSDAMLLAGGTDLLPNMKRRQQVPKTLIALRGVTSLQEIHADHESTIGAGATLTAITRHPAIFERHGALWQAALQVATPHLRNMGTLGGNLCLDTRCTYYDQSLEWRKAIGYCMKKDGTTCWVAPSSDRCLAVSSTDTAPALMALGARVRLVSTSGEREVDLADLYQNDGMDYLTRRADEVLASVTLPGPPATKSCYWKLRRRGAFDFPVLSVAAAASLDATGVVQSCRIVLGAVASRPLLVEAAAQRLIGERLTDAIIAEAAELTAQPAKPMDNTDFTLQWRKRVTAEFVTYALRDLRGDDLREIRRRIARHPLEMAAT